MSETKRIYLNCEMKSTTNSDRSRARSLMWEFHEVHHTANVLTPLTVFRVHPVDTWLFVNILAVVIGVTSGIASYALGVTTYKYALSGTNIILVVFIHVYIHLQQSHLWIAFRGLAGRVLMSPAHHQMHHSSNPIHFNRNLGSCLAIWDWLFGTLHVPAPETVKFEFVDLPDVAETFADSVHSLIFDGHNLRIVFCVSRFDEPKSKELPQGKRYPPCRLVLSAQGVLDLINRIQKISAALVRDGVLKAKPPGAAGDKTS